MKTMTLLAPALLTLTASAAAQTVTGIVFEDIDRDGVHDFGEPLLASVPVTIYGHDGAVDVTVQTAADGSYTFSVATGAKYVLAIDPGSAMRFSFQDLGADADPIPDWPQGRKRPSVVGSLVPNLRLSSPLAPLLHVALGDSLAYGFNLCDSPMGQNGYVVPITVRLDGVNAAALSKLAVPGYPTAALLDPAKAGTIFDAILAGAQLVTISIGANDLLKGPYGDDAKTAANLVTARQNLQEILSSLVTELPDADVILNTVYDWYGGNDSFNNTWFPVWNQMLRDVAWGQQRRVAVAEIWPDYEHLDPATGTKLGEDNLICLGSDTIHPNKFGYDLHEEKVWQGLGGVNVGSGSFERDFGFVQRMETRFPTTTLDVGGGASSESDALAQDDIGAIVPGGDQELQLLGFDATPRGLLDQVVVRVRYRTSAPPGDDVYRFEASVDGTFVAAGSTSTTWNTVVPIVGGAGNNNAKVLAYPDQPGWRDVSALVTKGAAGDGAPTVTWQDLATLAVRLRGAATGSADPFDVEWDVASIDLYGVPSYRLLLRGSPAIGAQLQVDVTGPEGDDVWMFVSGGTGSVPFPPWGTLLVNPSSFLLLNVGTVGATGANTIVFDIPNDPTLVGVTVYVQSLVAENYHPKIGALTNLASVTFE